MPTRRGLGDEGERDLVLNLKTAKRLGLSFTLPLLGRADKVIEYRCFFFAALHMSAIGTKQTYRGKLTMSAFGGEADSPKARCKPTPAGSN